MPDPRWQRQRRIVHKINQEGNGAPERIRTSDPQIRSLVLYPAELRVLACVPLAAAMGG